MRKLYVLSILGSLGISACSGDEGTDTPSPPTATGGASSGAGGKATGGTATGGTATGGVATGGVATGGVATGGTATGGAPIAGGGAGGATGGAPAAGGGAGGALGGGGAGGGGAGGTAAGSGGKGGGGAGGAVGGAAGGGSGGGPTVTFGAVSDLIGKRCGTPNCHDSSGKHTNLMNNDVAQLRTRLLGAPIGDDADCKSQTLVVPSMPEKSLLIAKLGADNAARNGCGDRMPLGCGKGGVACLTDAEVMTIRNWVAAGAPQ